VKQIALKYKELTVSQQLHLNAQSVKLATLKLSNEKLKGECEKLKEKLAT